MEVNRIANNKFGEGRRDEGYGRNQLSFLRQIVGIGLNLQLLGFPIIINMINLEVFTGDALRQRQRKKRKEGVDLS